MDPFSKAYVIKQPVIVIKFDLAQSYHCIMFYNYVIGNAWKSSKLSLALPSKINIIGLISAVIPNRGAAAH